MTQHNSHQRKRTGVLAVAVAVTALAMLATGCTRTKDTVTTTTVGVDVAGTDSEASQQANNTATMTVLLDGWSERALREQGIRWVSGTRSSALKLKPATAAQLTGLLDTEPQAVAMVLSRLVTADPSLRCTKRGCTTSSSEIDLASLTDPKKGPYGEVLEAAGVRHGLFLGTVDVAALGDVTLNTVASTDSAGAAGNAAASGSVTLPVMTVASERAARAADPNATEPDSQDGSNSPDEQDGSENLGESDLVDSAVAVGFAYGQLFRIDPSWVNSDQTQGPAPFGRLTTETVLGYPQDGITEPATFVALPNGLGSPISGGGGAVGLSSSQLTALSSPTTGCGVGSWCSPTSEHLTVTALSQQTRLLCDAVLGTRSDGSAGTPVSVVVVARSEKWEVRDATVNQFGFWDVDPPDGQLLFWPAPAPVVNTATRYVRTLETYTVGPSLLMIAGSVTATDAPWGVDEALAASATGDRFAPCTVGP